MPNVPAPTIAQHDAAQRAFRFFNRALFAGKLPNVMLNFSRKANTFGWYCPEVWANGKRVIAEISLNPDTFHRPILETYSTLVHEMVHHWQAVFGKPARKGYHNREWSEKMRDIGLQPVSSQLGVDSDVGQSMTHVVIPLGEFETACQRIEKDAVIPYTAISLAPRAKAKKAKANKVKYTCQSCEANVWGKPDLHVRCEDCDESFLADSE